MRGFRCSVGQSGNVLLNYQPNEEEKNDLNKHLNSHITPQIYILIKKLKKTYGLLILCNLST